MASTTGEEVKMPPFAAIIALTLASVIPAHGVDRTETMLVGKTNIYCVQQPCPWRGIRRADQKATGPSSLLWAEHNLPELDARRADANRLSAAWSDSECLVIEGGFNGVMLQVDRILGACPQ